MIYSPEGQAVFQKRIVVDCRRNIGIMTFHTTRRMLPLRLPALGICDIPTAYQRKTCVSTTNFEPFARMRSHLCADDKYTSIRGRSHPREHSNANNNNKLPPMWSLVGSLPRSVVMFCSTAAIYSRSCEPQLNLKELS